MLPTNDEVHVYSSGPDALWELARVNATLTPDRREVNLSKLKGRWPAGNGTLLVWFRSIAWPTYLFPIEELGEIANVEEAAHLREG